MSKPRRRIVADAVARPAVLICKVDATPAPGPADLRHARTVLR